MTSSSDLAGRARLATGPARSLLYGAVVLSVMAGVIHLLVTPEHLEEWVGYGLFFLVVGVLQLNYPVLLLGRAPSRGVIAVGIVGNLLMIGLYVFTRTIGVPFFGPAAWVVEEIGAFDLAAKAAEVALILCLAGLLWSAGETSRRST